MTLGEKIQLSRKKKGMSQEDLANLLNVSRQAVQKWERGTSNPELNKIVEISNALDVSIDWLLKDKVEEPISEPKREATSEQSTNSYLFPSEKHLNPKRIKVIKVWMIIGCVLTPMAAGGSYLNNQYKPEAFFFLFLYLVTIPLCVAAISRCRSAKQHSDLIALGIVGALFVSFIGGILMLTSRDKFFISDRPKTKEEIEADKKAEEERERKLAAEKEQAKINGLRISKIDEVLSLQNEFDSKKYNPSDKNKALNERKVVVQKINEVTDKTVMTELVNSYKGFLSSFDLDLDFYAKLEKRNKKIATIVCVSILAICVSIGAGFGIAAIAKSVKSNNLYNKANTAMENGDYQSALSTYESLGSYKESTNKAEVCRGLIQLDKSIDSKSEDDIIGGIRKIVSGNEKVTIKYSSDDLDITKRLLNSSSGSTYEEVAETYNYSLYRPTQTGYQISWKTTDFNYLDNMTYLNLGENNRNAIEYSITYVLNGGINSENNPTTFTVEDEIVLINPTKAGYSFAGWTLNNETITTISRGTIGNLRIVANWNINSYNVNLFTNNFELGTVSGGGSYEFNSAVTITANATYQFYGWYSDSECKNLVSLLSTYTFILEDGDVNLYAKFLTEIDANLYKNLGRIPVLSNDGKTITYGMYPQKHVSNSSLITELNNLEEPSIYDWYEYNGDFYAKMEGHPSGSNHVFSDNVYVEEGTLYWFKVEPIEWFVYKGNDDNYSLLSNKILDTSRYHNSSNNYEGSLIRNWLNEDFLSKAFGLEQRYINTVEIDNSAKTTNTTDNQYACANTFDKVYLLSYQDYLNTEYGFVPNTADSVYRWCNVSDYAICNYANVYEGRGDYWTRSPGSNYETGAWHIDNRGRLYQSSHVVNTFGVRPAINITFN